MLSQFDEIYVINLPHRVDRRAEMEVELAKANASFAQPNVHLFPAVRPTDAGGFESIGARGCFMSHLGVLKHALGKRNVLILEDDLNLVAGAKVPQLPAEWDIFYGGGRHAVESTGSLTRVPFEHGVGCAHFVAFNGPEIPRVVEFLESVLRRPPGDPLGGPMHVDGAYCVYRARHPEVKTFIATPELGFQRSSRSDIAPLRWFDKAALRHLASFARRLRRKASSLV